MGQKEPGQAGTEPGAPGGTAALDLVHELIDCIAAIATYAEAAERAQTVGPPIGPARLPEALEKLLAQAGRAGRVAHRLRRALQEPRAGGPGEQ